MPGHVTWMVQCPGIELLFSQGNRIKNFVTTQPYRLSLLCVVQNSPKRPKLALNSQNVN